MNANEDFRLTRYSHGAGCGCKISPKMLERILRSTEAVPEFPRLLVGNESRDDAAVYDLGDGSAIVSTTDFFMPIVDDPVDFGRIAAVNALSDVYAMGGTPLLAIAVLGWPVNSLPLEAARLVLEGGRKACTEAGIPLAGGHSIDNPEPIFGLAVTGRVRIEHLKCNTGARPGAKLFLTKPLGVGILTTAQKKGVLSPEHGHIARDLMVVPNRAGEVFGTMDCIYAMTDVTGFGLLGHLNELCNGSGLSARIEYTKVPVIDSAILGACLEKHAVPGGTLRNFESYGHEVSTLTTAQRDILCDPQTSGGLLLAVDGQRTAEFLDRASRLGMKLSSFGEFVPRGEKNIYVD